MGQRDELEPDAERLKRIGKESEKQEAARYSIWDRLAKIIIGKDDQERRDYSTRKPDTE